MPWMLSMARSTPFLKTSQRTTGVVHNILFLKICVNSSLQVVDGSPIEVTLAKPVDKDSYVRYTRGTGGRGGSLLQTDYTAYTLGQAGPQTLTHFRGVRRPSVQLINTSSFSSFSFPSRCTTHQQRISGHRCFTPPRPMLPYRASSAFQQPKLTLEVEVWFGRRQSEVRMHFVYFSEGTELVDELTLRWPHELLLPTILLKHTRL